MDEKERYITKQLEAANTIERITPEMMSRVDHAIAASFGLEKMLGKKQENKKSDGKKGEQKGC